MDAIKDLLVSTNKTKLDINLIHSFLTKSYWAEGRSLEQVKKSIENSICFGAYLNEKQIGFARIITDKVILAYILDVFIIEEERGKGYSKKLISFILEHPEFSGIKTWLLATSDAHGLYEKFGFKTVTETNKLMKRQIRDNK